MLQRSISAARQQSVNRILRALNISVAILAVVNVTVITNEL